MKRRLLIVLCLLLAGLGNMGVFTLEARTPGEPIGGLLLKIDIPEKTWRIGETYQIQVTLSNVSDKAMVIDVFGVTPGQKYILPGKTYAIGNWGNFLVQCQKPPVAKRKLSEEDFVTLGPKESYKKQLTCTVEGESSLNTVTYEVILGYFVSWLMWQDVSAEVEEMFQGETIYRGQVIKRSGKRPLRIYPLSNPQTVKVVYYDDQE